MLKFSNKYWHQDYSSRHLSKNNIFQWNATSSIKSREGIPKPVKLRSSTKTLHFCQKCQRLSVKKISPGFVCEENLFLIGFTNFAYFHPTPAFVLELFSIQSNNLLSKYGQLWLTLPSSSILNKHSGIGWGGRFGYPPIRKPQIYKDLKTFWD